MDKTHNISLGGFSFLIEDKAYQELSKYLNEVRKSLGNTADTNEIIYDVEQRMAELLKTQMKGREVIVSQDVDYLISVLGRPEQYVDLEEETQKEAKFTTNEKQNRIVEFFRHKRLYRDLENKLLAGVFAGFGHFLAIEKTWLRFAYLWLFALSALIFRHIFYFSKVDSIVVFFPWLAIYVLLALIIPSAKTTAEKLAMRGKAVNIDTISSIKEIKMRNGLQLTRSLENRKLFGVFGGLSKHYGWNVTGVRIAYLVLTLATIPLFEGFFTFMFILCYVFLVLSMNKRKTFFEKEDDYLTEDDFNAESDFSQENAPKQKMEFVYKKSDFSIWSIIRGFFKGVLYVIIGFVLLILLFNLLSLLLALFGIGIAGWGVGFSVLTLTDYLSFIVEGNWQLWIAYFSAASLFILPVLVISILCLKLFSKKGYQVSKAWILLNVFLFFFGVMGVITVSVDTFKHFQAYDSVEERIPVAVSDTISLSYEKQPHRYYKYDILNFGSPILKDDNEIIAKGDFVRFRIGETSEKEPYIILKKYSRGRNLSDAQAKASQVKYNLKIEANKIVLPEKYSLGENPKIRDQRIEVVLYLPQGKHITSSDEELSVLEFRSNKWIDISRGGVAKMTENGLVKIENN
ncbi:PspC domain-containing protein [Capnocytophaga canimorsus]|uniref:PspC domain-containing protein n=1 Tax=Capnocytophaga canimorsus TaxID=28188 RepID=UPI000D6E0041|nr:PspC domain-containing protein [Capnocytophaga canimorsus]AWL77697.1 PspC domain-containing protein [Capnocytophaga canimorsus]